MNKQPIVIKVGGSLLGLRRLHAELAEFLDGLDTHQVVLLTGGGPAVKALHHLSKTLPFTEAEAHWHCIDLMSDLTHSLSETYPNSVAVNSWVEAERAWEVDRIPWFVVESYLRADDHSEDHLPHRWDVSSDSIAAHLAARYGAELILLKACELPKRKASAKTLAKRGIVDAWFPKIADEMVAWSIRNLPGGTVPEISLDLVESKRPVRSRRKPPRAPRSRRAAPTASKVKRRRK